MALPLPGVPTLLGLGPDARGGHILVDIEILVWPDMTHFHDGCKSIQILAQALMIVMALKDKDKYQV